MRFFNLHKFVEKVIKTRVHPKSKFQKNVNECDRSIPWIVLCREGTDLFQLSSCHWPFHYQVNKHKEIKMERSSRLKRAFLNVRMHPDKTAGVYKADCFFSFEHTSIKNLPLQSTLKNTKQENAAKCYACKYKTEKL